MESQGFVELDDHVGQRQQVRDLGFEPLNGAMKAFLHVADPCPQREECLDDHAVIPLAASTNLQGGRRPLFLFEPLVRQGDAGVKDLIAVKGCVVYIGFGIALRHDFQMAVDRDGELSSDDPAVIGEPFPRDALALRGTSLADRMDHLHAKAVQDRKGRGLSQELVATIPVRDEQPLEPGPPPVRASLASPGGLPFIKLR